MSDVRNQLQTLTGAEIEASQLSTVGGKVFTNAQDAQVDLHALTSFWRAIHVPTYGQPIPGSAFKKTQLGDGVLYAPATNESAYITGITVTNGDPVSAAGVTIDLGGVIIANLASVASLGFEIALGLGDQPLMIAEGASLTVQVTGATPALVTVEAVGFLVVQG